MSTSSPPPSQTISSTRLTQLHATIHAYISTFEQPVSTPAALANFLAIYHPDIEWFDHAFHVRRVGHDAVLGLHRSFNFANEGFWTEIKKIHPTSTGAILEVIWHGTCANDIMRPSGEVVVKANGREFTTGCCLVLDIEDGDDDDEGDEQEKVIGEEQGGQNRDKQDKGKAKLCRIKRIDEYYNRKWEDGMHESEYVVMRGGGMTEKQE